MPELNHKRFDIVNHLRLPVSIKVCGMDSRKRLARNLTLLMERSADLKSQGALHRRSKVAQSTIDRILDLEVGATVDTLDKLARAFGTSAWQLLHPSGDADLYAKLRKFLDDDAPK